MQHPRDFSVAIAQLTRNDIGGRATLLFKEQDTRSAQQYISMQYDLKGKVYYLFAVALTEALLPFIQTVECIKR
jgi:hypothetical protein